MLNCLKHVARPGCFVYFRHDYVPLLFDLSIKFDPVDYSWHYQNNIHRGYKNTHYALVIFNL